MTEDNQTGRILQSDDLGKLGGYEHPSVPTQNLRASEDGEQDLQAETSKSRQLRIDLDKAKKANHDLNRELTAAQGRMKTLATVLNAVHTLIEEGDCRNSTVALDLIDMVL